jgi:elongation factor Ts
MQSDPHKIPPSPSPGAVGTYIHAGGKVGVLVELGCESEFVSQTEEFSELLHDIAMHIAASDPKFIRKEDVTAEAYQREKDIYASQAAATGKFSKVVEKIVEGKMSEFYEEVCLNEQPFIKDQTIKISDLIATKAGKLGEKIAVRRFARFKLGDSFSSVVADWGHGPDGGDVAGIAVKKPKSPNLNSGLAAANLDEESE